MNQKNNENKTMELFNIKNKFSLPEEYRGRIKKNGGLTRFDPREWTNEEIEWALMLRDKGLTNKQIAQCLDRDSVGVSIKMKRLKKEDGSSYNEKHKHDKYSTNELFLQDVNPKSILDVYSGEKSYYDKYSKNNNINLITNDINKNFNTSYNIDAFKLLCLLYSKGESFDIVDLDPFGSAYESFDIAIKIAKKGIIITFGEYGHKRWKRVDFVRDRYYINSIEDFNINFMINKVLTIAKRNKKTLKPIYIKEWTNICRVYFKIFK